MPAASKVKPRKDPKPRHLDGSAIWARLKNADPDRHYVYVNKGDPDAMAHYDAAGYEVVTLEPGGVCPAGGKTVRNGEPIEMRGLVLMSVSKERQAQIELEGADGNAGQAEADRIEQLIVDRRGFDPLRGMHSRFMSVSNEIGKMESEVGI